MSDFIVNEDLIHKQQCFDWCSQQYLANDFAFMGVFFLAFALSMALLAVVLYRGEVDEEFRNKLLRALSMGTMTAIAAGFLWAKYVNF